MDIKEYNGSHDARLKIQFRIFQKVHYVFENSMKIITFIIVIANAFCPSKCEWKIFDGDDKIASVDVLTFAGTDEQKELMDVFDQD